MSGIFDRLAGVEAVSDTQLGNGSLKHDTATQDLAHGAVPPAEERRTPLRIREAVQELLKYGFLEESQKPNLYRAALANTAQMEKILEPLDLAMGVDGVRGLLFVIVRQGDPSGQDDWFHPLVRRQSLNLEQSLLIAILRQHFIVYEQESGLGASQAQVAIDELIPQLQVYLGALGSDAKERNRIVTLLDQLKGHGLVSKPDVHDRVVIRPIITHLANPENLQALITWLRSQGMEACENEPQEGDLA